MNHQTISVIFSFQGFYVQHLGLKKKKNGSLEDAYQSNSRFKISKKMITN